MKNAAKARLWVLAPFGVKENIRRWQKPTKGKYLPGPDNWVAFDVTAAEVTVTISGNAWALQDLFADWQGEWQSKPGQELQRKEPSAISVRRSLAYRRSEVASHAAELGKIYVKTIAVEGVAVDGFLSQIRWGQ